jgi:hypothetical protein
MQSPKVRGGETRGDGKGPSHGAPTNFFLAIVFTIKLGRNFSEEKIELPDSRARSTLASCSMVKPASKASLMNFGVVGDVTLSSESSESSPETQNLDLRGVRSGYGITT